jgi:hypothetical protein
MRKVIFCLPVLISFHLLSQNEPKAALTVGSDTYMPYQGEGASITQTHSGAVIPYQPEAVISQGTVKNYPEPKSATSKDVIVLIAGLLIATAIYFIFRRNSAKALSEPGEIRLEDEHTPELKKKVWDSVSQSGQNHNN